MHRHVAPLFALTATFAAHADVVLFSGQVAQADIPSGYEHYFEEERQTLVIEAPGIKQAEVRFTFNSMKPYVKQRPTIGKDFVQDSAKKKGKAIFAIPENGGVAFIEHTKTTIYGSERVQETQGIMGLDDGYVTFTISIPEALAETDAARKLKTEGLRFLLGRIRSLSNRADG